MFKRLMFQKQYAVRFPHSAKPVVYNDVVYAIFVAIFALIIAIQALIYEKGDQRISKTVKSFLLFCGISMMLTIVLISHHVLEWLDFVYVCSYLKLAITLKYVPQVN